MTVDYKRGCYGNYDVQLLGCFRIIKREREREREIERELYELLSLLNKE